ncbi:MAG TPA: PLP-dependent aminotransferase family protein [Candidatus Paenalcaligenes intestinipullorum]|uniref:PLP-dependent aminotransferase family protein n=1 Tax=Candidatus Paenalcaligenes intestinipullorum TaxID=2838718 RepID=A0A9D2REL1_9BURK|nr:PLP-dependent aminotransferase family protein [Candidatus Paenalcaligenes intestinipullorum]
MESQTPSYVFSQRAQQLTSSAIREILKVTTRPEVISFAGGLPAPEGFPIQQINDAFDRALAKDGQAALQYGTTEGYEPLRQWIADYVSTDEAPVSPDEILIVSGSQQALDVLGKLFIDEGSKVLVESPTYLGALQAFSIFSPDYVSIATDEQGLIPSEVSKPEAQGARFIYTLPNFHNPMGITLSLERRQELVERCKAANIPIIEDDPYGELRYNGNALPSLLSLGRQAGATVIRMGSFSKVLAPGLRLGYIVAPQPIISKLVQIKQATDLHSSSITQMAVYEAIGNGFLTQHLPAVRELYKRQCDYMLNAMQEHFPDGVSWTVPEGGMFIWVTLPEHLRSDELLQQAIAQNVAFVPGGPFYIGADYPHNTLRLSFVTVSEARIQQGIAILGQILRDALQKG